MKVLQNVKSDRLIDSLMPYVLAVALDIDTDAVISEGVSYSSHMQKQIGLQLSTSSR